MSLNLNIERLCKVSVYVTGDVAPVTFQKKLIISDLHAGVGDSADNLFSNRELLDAVLAKYRADGFWIICAGDGYEFWENSPRTQPRINLLYPALSRVQTYLRGNHDSCIQGQEQYCLCDGQIVILHGHQVEPWNYRYAWIGRFFTMLWGFLERVFGAKVPEGYLSWQRRMALWKESPLEYDRFTLRSGFRFWRRLVAWAKRRYPNLRLLICGHTHIPALLFVGDENVYYANSGTFIWNPLSQPNGIELTAIASGVVEVVLVRFKLMELREDVDRGD